MSFALSAVVDGSQRVFETVIDTAGERLLFAKMVPAFAGNATGSAEVVHFACVLGFLPGPPATDVTSQVSIRARGFRKNRRSEEYAGSVRITNTGGKPLDAPMMLVFRPGENITLVSGDGFTCAVEPSGAPFRLLPVGSGLGPGQHVDIVLRFQNPDDDPIQLYAARVFAGPGFR